jgi:polyvinyl alcohol dehydrogenase (cytochrome)
MFADRTHTMESRGWRGGSVASLISGLLLLEAACSGSGSHGTPPLSVEGGSGDRPAPRDAEGGSADEAGAMQVAPSVPQPDCSADSTDWPFFGQNVCNTSSPASGGAINRDSVKTLKTKWVYTAAGDVSATPAIVAGRVYVPDWAGNILCLDANTGAVVWKKDVESLVRAADSTAGVGGYRSRTTPIVTSTSVIFGTLRDGAPLVSPATYGHGAYLVSVDKNTGALNWATPVHEGHPAANIASSPTYDGTNVYFGTSSSEEAFPYYNSAYKCCTFRGSIYAVNAATGTVVWHTHTISDSLYNSGANGGPVGGFTGVAQWSSAPVIDRKRKQLYVTTGNNYSIASGATGKESGNYVDAILALDIGTGAVKWVQSLPEGGQDIWTYTEQKGPDSDFGAGANLFTAVVHGTAMDLVGAGQKSGVYFAVDADSGAVVWKTQVGPGGHLGGIHWGTATDGVRIYVGVNNDSGSAWTLGGKGSQAGKMTSVGAWTALDPATGDILWQIANPAHTLPMKSTIGGEYVSVNGPVRAVNGVLFAGSMDAMGTMFAIDAATGDVLWSFQSGGTVYGGAAVSGNTVYWGSGYATSRLGFGTDSLKLYAFSPP